MNELTLLDSPDLETTLRPEWRKADLLNYAIDLVESRHSEGGDVLNLLVQAAKLELLATTIKEKAKAAGLTEVLSYGKAGVSQQGVSLTTAEVGVKYDYSADVVWQRLHQAVLNTIESRKVQETYLRGLPYEGRVTVDEETGETYRAYPPAKEGGTGVIVKIL